MPLKPEPMPLIERLRRITTSFAPAEMTMPLVPETSTLPSAPSPLMVIALVIVTAPNPPESSTLISPPAMVLEMAPANVLQGAVRLQGLASSPTPETQVRLAWANAEEASRPNVAAAMRAATEMRFMAGLS